jgi:hypothetical protein
MNEIVLEDAYALVQAKQFLLSEGYSNEEIDILIAEGKVWDAVKKVGKNVGRAAAIGAAGLSMMGGSAKAQSPNDSLKDVNQAITNVQNYAKHTSELRQIGEDADKLAGHLTKKLTDSQKSTVKFHLTMLKNKMLTLLGEDESNLDNVIQNLYKDNMLKNYNWNALNF